MSQNIDNLCNEMKSSMSEKTLILVYEKDDEYALCVNFLRKLIESNICNNEGNPVNIKEITIWDEKEWEKQDHGDLSKNKVIYIGKQLIKKALLPVIDVKYQKYGVKYGWCGRQAAIWTDYAFRTHLKKEEYEHLLDELKHNPNLSSLPKKKRQQVLLYGTNEFYLRDFEKFMMFGD